MSTRRIGRRLFLLGTGGFALAVPFLPSLVRRGEAQMSAPPKRFVAMNIPHGGVKTANMWPSEDRAREVTRVLGDHDVHHSPIEYEVDGDDTVISNVLRAPGALLTPSLVGKMNLLRGLDVPWYCAHGNHTLGNYGPTSLAESDTGTERDQPTIDQVMAYSPGVYASEPRRRSLHVGHAGSSMVWANPSARSGEIEVVPTASSTQALFDEIYVPVDPGSAPRAPVVDRVFESYSRVRNGAHGPGARLGRADRERLDDYMERLARIQRSMGAAAAASCGDVRVPTEQWEGRAAEYTPYAHDVEYYGEHMYGLYNDVLVAAFMCDTSRIATIMSVDDFHGSMDSVGGFHEVAHTAEAQPEREAMLQVTSRNFFRLVFLDLVSKLDAVSEADGSSILDHSLVFWTHESGPATHINDSQPVITAGGAGGALNTGLYVDYRNRLGEWDPALSADGRRPGLHYYQWYATCLNAMGVAPSEWPHGPDLPFSGWNPDPGATDVPHPYLDRVLEFSRESLPVISV